MTERHILLSENFERAVANFNSSMEVFRRSVDFLSNSLQEFTRAVDKLKIIEGMKAENADRLSKGLPLLYTEEQFFDL